MSAAGRPPRERVKATTSATVELSLPERRSSHSASALGLSAPYSVVGSETDDRHERVVLQVAPDARQVVAHLHAGGAQVVGRADARQQQQLRRVDRARRQQHLALGAHELLAAAPLAQAHADGPLALQLDAQDADVRAHLQVRALGRRAQEGVGRAEALAVSLCHLEHRRAVLLRPVVVDDPRDSRGGARLQQPPVHRARRALLGDAQRTARAVELRGPACVVLGLDEVRQHVAVAPAGRALCLPGVVVERAPAHVQHRVHRARPAEAPAARDVQRAVVDVRLGLGRVIPVELCVELVGERRWDLDVQRAIAPAGLQQQHSHRRVLRQPICEHAARRPGSDDHVVVHSAHPPAFVGVAAGLAGAGAACGAAKLYSRGSSVCVCCRYSRM
jgi:hypothetical protein